MEMNFTSSNVERVSDISFGTHGTASKEKPIIIDHTQLPIIRPT